MALAAALVWIIPWPRMTALATQIGFAPASAQPLDANMVTGCELGHGHPCGHWWQPGPGTSTQTTDPNVVLGSSLGRDVPALVTSEWPRRPLGLPWPLQQYGPWMSAWLQVAANPTGLCTALSGGSSHRRQHRPPWLLQGLRTSNQALALVSSPFPLTCSSTFSSSDPPFSPAHEPLSLPFPQPVLAHHDDAQPSWAGI